MSFLSRLFGTRNQLDEIRKVSSQNRWADVLSYSASLNPNSLTEIEQSQLLELVDSAAEQLAHVNYEEGLASLRADDFRRGKEHLELARKYVRTNELRELIESELTRIGVDINSGDILPRTAPVFKNSCTSSCCGSGVEPSSEASSHVSGFDEETRFDLVLTAYPLDIRPRYLELSSQMRQAILLAHEERGDEALVLFTNFPPNERNDIFYYELGTLYARLSRYQDAVNALQQALVLNPAYLLSVLGLVDLHLLYKNYPAAENLLSQMLQSNCMPDYCHARLSVICQAQGDSSKAFEYAKEALALGYNDSELIVFVARALEEQGLIDEAESVLSSIQVGGGCSGGANIELADFWLRHKKNLHKSLEMFKKAAVGDPTNPIWGYHIARVYLALGWKKDAKKILESFVTADLNDGSLRDNANQLLKDCA